MTEPPHDDTPFWRRLINRYDETKLIKAVFFGMLGGVVVTLGLDYREMRAQAAYEMPDPARAVPVLPAAPNSIEPAQTTQPSDVTTPAELHRAPMTVKLAADGVLELTGSIVPGTADTFLAEVNRVGEYVTTVALDSPGGSLDDALTISSAIRERGFDTLVRSGSLCASACPVIFAGGVERVAEPKAAIGLHQIYAAATDTVTSPAEAMSGAQATTARVSRHLEEMGVDPSVWTFALETPPRQLYYLSAKELKDYDLATSMGETVANGS